jgi:hypothetical protein
MTIRLQRRSRIAPKTKTNTTRAVVLTSLSIASGLMLAVFGPLVSAQTRYVVHEAPSGSHEQLLAADDAAWTKATEIRWGSAGAETTFKALWNDRGLYVRFDAMDMSPWHTMTKRDEHLWDEEVVEIFLDVNRSGRNYAELEINPANVICDVLMIAPAPDKKNDLTWNIDGLESRVTNRGVFAGGSEPPSRGARWIPVAFMPWTGFKSLPSAAGIALPPTRGTAWRFNVFRIERPGGPKAPEDHAIFAAWSPISGESFHEPAAFRDFVFQQ